MSQPPSETTKSAAGRQPGAAGFAGLPRSERQRLAAIGGRAAHACGKAHEFSPEEAIVAGRLGGLQVSADRSHMARLGRLGAARRMLLRRAAEQRAAGGDSNPLISPPGVGETGADNAMEQ